MFSGSCPQANKVPRKNSFKHKNMHGFYNPSATKICKDNPTTNGKNFLSLVAKVQHPLPRCVNDYVNIHTQKKIGYVSININSHA